MLPRRSLLFDEPAPVAVSARGDVIMPAQAKTANPTRRKIPRVKTEVFSRVETEAKSRL
jgi:hypothetical protein